MSVNKNAHRTPGRSRRSDISTGQSTGNHWSRLRIPRGRCQPARDVHGHSGILWASSRHSCARVDPGERWRSLTLVRARPELNFAPTPATIHHAGARVEAQRSRWTGTRRLWNQQAPAILRTLNSCTPHAASLSFDQLSHVGAVDLGDVDRALLVDGDRGRILEPVDALDHSAILDAGDVQAVALGAVDDVEAIALDEDAPRRAEIRPLRDELAALIEHLDALVAAIADVEPPLRIDGDAVRLVELSRLGPLAAPPSDELAVLRVLDYPRVGALAVGDEDVAVLRDDQIGHAVERVARLIVAGDALAAERHQQLAVGAELEDLVVAAIGDPDMPRAIGAQKMRRLEHVLAPGAEEAAVLVECYDRHRRVAVEDVDVAFRVDVDAGRAAPRGHALGKRHPVVDKSIRPGVRGDRRSAGGELEHH